MTFEFSNSREETFDTMPEALEDLHRRTKIEIEELKQWLADNILETLFSDGWLYCKPWDNIEGLNRLLEWTWNKIIIDKEDIITPISWWRLKIENGKLILVKWWNKEVISDSLLWFKKSSKAVNISYIRELERKEQIQNEQDTPINETLQELDTEEDNEKPEKVANVTETINDKNLFRKDIVDQYTYYALTGKIKRPKSSIQEIIDTNLEKSLSQREVAEIMKATNNMRIITVRIFESLGHMINATAQKISAKNDSEAQRQATEKIFSVYEQYRKSLIVEWGWFIALTENAKTENIQNAVNAICRELDEYAKLWNETTLWFKADHNQIIQWDRIIPEFKEKVASLLDIETLMQEWNHHIINNNIKELRLSTLDSLREGSWITISKMDFSSIDWILKWVWEDWNSSYIKKQIIWDVERELEDVEFKSDIAKSLYEIFKKLWTDEVNIYDNETIKQAWIEDKLDEESKKIAKIYSWKWENELRKTYEENKEWLKEKWITSFTEYKNKVIKTAENIAYKWVILNNLIKDYVMEQPGVNKENTPYIAMYDDMSFIDIPLVWKVSLSDENASMLTDMWAEMAPTIVISWGILWLASVAARWAFALNAVQKWWTIMQHLRAWAWISWAFTAWWAITAASTRSEALSDWDWNDDFMEKMDKQLNMVTLQEFLIWMVSFGWATYVTRNINAIARMNSGMLWKPLFAVLEWSAMTWISYAIRDQLGMYSEEELQNMTLAELVMWTAMSALTMWKWKPRRVSFDEAIPKPWAKSIDIPNTSWNELNVGNFSEILGKLKNNKEIKLSDTKSIYRDWNDYTVKYNWADLWTYRLEELVDKAGTNSLLTDWEILNLAIKYNKSLIYLKDSKWNYSLHKISKNGDTYKKVEAEFADWHISWAELKDSTEYSALKLDEQAFLKNNKTRLYSAVNKLLKKHWSIWIDGDKVVLTWDKTGMKIIEKWFLNKFKFNDWITTETIKIDDLISKLKFGQSMRILYEVWDSSWIKLESTNWKIRNVNLWMTEEWYITYLDSKASHYNSVSTPAESIRTWINSGDDVRINNLSKRKNSIEWRVREAIEEKIKRDLSSGNEITLKDWKKIKVENDWWENIYKIYEEWWAKKAISENKAISRILDDNQSLYISEFLRENWKQGVYRSWELYIIDGDLIYNQKWKKLSLNDFNKLELTNKDIVRTISIEKWINTKLNAAVQNIMNKIDNWNAKITSNDLMEVKNNLDKLDPNDSSLTAKTGKFVLDLFFWWFEKRIWKWALNSMANLSISVHNWIMYLMPQNSLAWNAINLAKNGIAMPAIRLMTFRQWLVDTIKDSAIGSLKAIKWTPWENWRINWINFSIKDWNWNILSKKNAWRVLWVGANTVLPWVWYYLTNREATSHDNTETMKESSQTALVWLFVWWLATFLYWRDIYNESQNIDERYKQLNNYLENIDVEDIEKLGKEKINKILEFIEDKEIDIENEESMKQFAEFVVEEKIFDEAS